MSDTSPYSGLYAVIAEDSQHMRTLLRSMLRALGFEHVSAESNGADALRRIQIEVPDVILLDWNMPGLSGIDVVQNLRNMPEPFCRVPTIMVTAHASKMRLQEAKKFGVNSFLCKPVSVSALEIRLRSILQNAHVEQELPKSPQPARKPIAHVEADPPDRRSFGGNKEGDTELESFYV